MSLSPEGHKIGLEHAAAMTAAYRLVRTENYPICETFSAAAVQKLLNQPGCQYLRIYYGIKADQTVHAILVGADHKEADIIPADTPGMSEGDGDGEGEILEDGQRCPENCPPESPLNSNG